MTKDGKPYKPFRYKELVHERYYISKFCHTSYGDTGNITPKEKNLLLEFLISDIKAENDAREKAKGVQALM